MYGICFARRNWFLVKLQDKELQISKDIKTFPDGLLYPECTGEKPKADWVNDPKNIIRVVYTIVRMEIEERLAE